MEMAIESALGLQFVNLVLLGILISIYVRNLTKFRSTVTIGLLIFASVLFVQNIVGIYLGVDYMSAMTEPFEHYALAMNLTQTIALLALFWISWK